MDDDVHERRNNISEISSFGDFQINSPGPCKVIRSDDFVRSVNSFLEDLEILYQLCATQRSHPL